ncbi:MAG: histone deacetylase, partial [Chloroflexi bacterium]
MDDIVFFYPHGHEAHFLEGHPERPERIEAAVEGLTESSYWDRYPKIEPIEISQEVLLGVHTMPYLSLLETSASRGSFLDGDTYTRPASWQLALNAAGGAAACAVAVWKGRARRAYALTRPPGHHAGPGYGMGFCLINNIAVAAEYLLKTQGAEKLAIVDIDLHHGNGTQDIFYQRSDVLYISTHQAPFYPGSGEAGERGRGGGLGTTANIPLPPYSGDEAFRSALDRAILPLLYRYSPQMLLVSMGFDTHWIDPLGHLQLCTQVQGELIAALTAWAEENCGGRITVILEGGYDLDASAA